MILKITMMSGQEIPLESEEALNELLAQANAGKKLILTKYGVVNVASIDSITRHKEMMGYVSDRVRVGKTQQEAITEQLGPSPFAGLLGGESKRLKG